MSENSLTELPHSFVGLVNLRKLFLSCNQLKALPSGFEVGWINLDTLGIFNCLVRGPIVVFQ